MDCKKIVQNQENKEKYTSPLLDILKDDWVDKETLMDKLSMTERAVRSQLSELAMFYPVAFSSEHKGYRLPKLPSECDESELITFIAMIEKTLQELSARVTVLNKRMKPLIAYLSIANELVG